MTMIVTGSFLRDEGLDIDIDRQGREHRQDLSARQTNKGMKRWAALSYVETRPSLTFWYLPADVYRSAESVSNGRSSASPCREKHNHEVGGAREQLPFEFRIHQTLAYSKQLTVYNDWLT